MPATLSPGERAVNTRKTKLIRRTAKRLEAYSQAMTLPRAER
jgi:hypothetical protein